MFKDCTIKYQRAPDNPSNDKDCILVTYPKEINLETKEEYDFQRTLIVPINEENRHYQAVQQWVADGNTIEDAD
jgi:hypothetical protein